MSPPNVDPHVTAIATHLATQMDIAVGAGKKPDDVGWQGEPGASDYVGYLTVQSIPGGTLDGSIAETQDDGWLPVQVNGYGATYSHAQQLVDTARGHLLVHPPAIAVAGRDVGRIEIDVIGGCDRDDDDPPSQWWAYDRFRIYTTPA